MNDDLLVVIFVVRARLNTAKGQRDGNRGSAMRRAFNLDLAIVAAHVSLRDTKAQSCALAALGGKERFENVRQYVSRNSAAGINHPHFNRFAGGDLVGGNRNPSAFRRRLCRIQQKVHEDLRKLIRIHANGRQVPAERCSPELAREASAGAQ